MKETLYFYMQRILYFLIILPGVAWSQNAGQQVEHFSPTNVDRLAAPHTVTGLTNVLSLACQVAINDGRVHTVGDAPSGSCFHGVKTLAGLATITINTVQPFSWLAASSNNIFVSTTGAYKLTDNSAPKLDIAWLCIQTALLGGKTYIPAGTYIVGSAIPLPLTIPSGVNSGGNLGGIYSTIAGDGPRQSIIKPGYDWGSGYHLMICGDPTGTVSSGLGRYGGHNFPGDIQGIGFFSSSRSFLFPTGVASIQMDGFGWGARLRMQDVESSGFNHDLTMVGDHTELIRVHLNGGAVGMYLTEPSRSNFGDLQFLDFTASGQSQAAISVSPHATLSAIFNGETYLAAPYSILGEADTDGRCRAITAGTQFDRLMAEYTGDALVSDDTGYSDGSYRDSAKCRDFSKVFIRDLFMSWDNSHFWGGPGRRQRRAAIDVRAMSLTVDNLECDSGCWTPASVAAPNGSTLVGTVNLSQASDHFGANMIRGGVQTWISRSGSLPLLAGGFGPVFDGFAFENQNGTWGGIVDYAYTPTATYSTHSAGEVIQYKDSYYYATGGATADLQPVAGICAQSGVAIALNSAYIPIVTHGRTAVDIAFQSPKAGPWKMGTGIGGLTISSAGKGGVDGTYRFASSGGGCAIQPAGTFTVRGGAITGYSVTNYGAGCKGAPTISTASARGLDGSTLSARWPAGIAVPASSWLDGMILGTGRNGSTSTTGNSIAIALTGLH